jgi:enoyl-CoA hydratase/carnithine racemase
MAAAGLANRAVPADKLHDCVAGIVATLAERSPLGLHRMKQMVNDGVDMSWDLAARYELALAEGHIGTDVPIEGLAAFVERRKPRFRS